MFDLRTLVSLILGLLFSIGIWLAVPYNNFALNNSFISDSYLPEVVVLGLFVLIFGINPVLRRFLPGCEFERRHLVLICGMMLFASILPSNGLMRFFPHALASNTEQINESAEMADAVVESDLPAALFPDPIGHDIETPASSQLMDELYPDNSIPWSSWAVPLLAWGTLIIAFWVVMIGMGLMVFPQWLNVERLSFPLLKIYHAVLEDPKPNDLLPPVFRSRLFWIGCGTVFLLHSMNGLSIFTDDAFPGFPLRWNLSPILTEGIWRYVPGFFKSTQIYFIFVGLAFFMPTRYSFSIWFTIMAAGLFIMYASMYLPTFEGSIFYDMGAGALIAMAVGVVWLGRFHYKRVFLAAIGRPDPELGNPNDALSGRLFLGGSIVMLGWFIWAGTGPIWAAVFVFLAIVIMLMVTRIVAETGLTYLWIIPLSAERIIGVFPSKWINVSAAFMEGAHYILVNRASAVSAAAITVLTLGLNPKASPQRHRRLAGLGLVVLLIGFVVCGAVHLNMEYKMPTSLDGVNTPVVGRGATQMLMGPLQQVASGRESAFDAPVAQHILAGLAIAGVLLYLCGRFPGWPLHPIGMIFVYSSIGLRLFMSLFIGWAIKTMLVQIAGARAYRIAMPLFLGLIAGEIFANAVWTLVPAIQILMGADPTDVRRMIIFQYT